MNMAALIFDFSNQKNFILSVLYSEINKAFPSSKDSFIYSMVGHVAKIANDPKFIIVIQEIRDINKIPGSEKITLFITFRNTNNFTKAFMRDSFK